MVKEVKEMEFKFYANYDSAVLGIDSSLSIVEVEGSVPPTQVVKTVLKDKYNIFPVGPAMAIIDSVENLASARFQLVKIKYDIPVRPYNLIEDVYIFESYI